MEEPGLRERRAVARLLRFYRPGAGRWIPPTGAAWQLALAIEAVVTAYSRTRDPSYQAALRAWLRRHRTRRSRYYDDNGWYVNAWLRAYEATGEESFLAAARSGFTDLTSGWDAVCGGGLWWSEDRTYKNAITTGLFLLAAARLARLGVTARPATPGDDTPRPRGASPSTPSLEASFHGRWALRAWEWFDAVGLLNSENLVNDGLDGCRNNRGTTWTYNQGILISALVELWRLDGSRRHIDRAHTIAAAATDRLVHRGGLILREPNEPECDRDQQIFKGVLAQGLGRLCAADPAGSAAHRAALIANADAVWSYSRDPDDGLGLAWCGPPARVTPATHASATLLLGEVALLSAGGAAS